jgi:DUF4097 and DUF4098 domain-containing protein YvlB
MQRDTLILTLATLALAAAPLHADGPTWREQSELTRDADGIAMVAVDDARGQVRLQPSSDGRIHIRALKVVRSRSLEDAKRIARETLVEVDQSEGRLVIRVRYPHLHVHLNLWENMSGELIPNDEVRLAIELPPALAAEVNSASADVTSDGVGGNQRLRTASGDVTVLGAAGPVAVSTASGDVSLQDLMAARVVTASGDIEVDGARGALDLESTSGDLTLRGVADSLRVRTVSGTVRVDAAPRGADINAMSGEVTLAAASGRVRARTVSGDLEVQLARALSNADLGTQSGTLTVTLDPALACTLKANTGSGEIELEGTGQVTRHGHGSTSASFRGGGTPVGLRTVSGDIRVVVGGGK